MKTLEIGIDHCHLVAVDLYHNDFVSRWADLFEKTVASCSINQIEAFSCNLTQAQAQQRLIAAIDAINHFLKRSFIDVPAEIDWNDKQWYNYLHSKFEQISGSYGKPTRLFMIAPRAVKQAIRSLNFYVHRLEAQPYIMHPPWYISFDKDCYTRMPLRPEDYALFCDQIESGQAFIHYAELGKTMIELYEDGLPKTYPGLKNLHFYSAEISIHLGHHQIEIISKGFKDWAKQNLIDLGDPRQGLGIIPIGEVRNIDTAKQIVYNGSSITNLRITHHGQTI